jgi:hypothetical protein
MIKAFLLTGCALALTGCVSMSRSSAVAALPLDVAANAKVTEIRLVTGPDVKVTPQFDAVFQKHVQAKLDGCFKGERAVRLEAQVDRLDKSNAVLTAVVAGANVLRGSAKLVDLSTGRTVADYNVGQTVVGGRFAVVVMAEAEEQLSDGFGDELCKQAFPTISKK